MANPNAQALNANLFERIVATPAGQTLVHRLEKGHPVSCLSVSTGAQPFLAALVHWLFPSKRVALVAPGVKLQECFWQDLESWLEIIESARPSPKPGHTKANLPASSSIPKPLYYPSWEILPHEDRLPHADVISERLETLIALAGKRSAPVSSVIVTNVTALMQRTFRPKDFESQLRLLRPGDHLDPLDLVEWLEGQGYEPEVQVTQKGEIALRGGILDVYPLSSPWPVRVEFFGDEIESIRQFDPTTQISRASLTEVTLPPGGELGILKRSRDWENSRGADGLTTRVPTLVDYFMPGDVMILCEPTLLQEQAEDYTRHIHESDPNIVTWNTVLDTVKEAGLQLIRCSEGDAGEGEGTDLGLESLESFRPGVEHSVDVQVVEVQRREFFGQMHRWLRQNYSVHVFCNNEGERDRFVEIWDELGPTDSSAKETPRQTRANSGMHGGAGFYPTTHLGSLTRGFLGAQAKIVVVTDAEIFGRYKIQRPRRMKRPHAPSSRSLLDIDFSSLEEGDYVVHLEHGIGRYQGLTSQPLGRGVKPLEKATRVSGRTQECLVIEYAPSSPDQPPSKLYVPVSESHLVSKYVGAGKARPPLHTLGGKRWLKSKEQAEQAVRDLASELLSIQAARSSLSGHGFGQDTSWQREFESAFLYEETPDQMRAIIETKADLERPKPMDRLICGDVGYGKTEVAIRAAFKAVMGGKQVAVLVPTTVLAQQHFNTFRERMADYPVRVELMSRFRTTAQQRAVLQELSTGAVDIVIGTHRLVQQDVSFKDLGLVVVDEEQRFGVLHKEKFKQMRRLVDVLTLSATPIPRTLHLALTGARDMSTIETPPQDRLPVETIVCEYDERVIRDAIQRELNREGQVFFLHNRVFDIEKVAARIGALVPQARVVVGHGQMHADELESVMTRFVNGEADVLLSTTIIESGIDIPNANTIIIDRADRFGLSDLYQLRGRVGRYKHQAYAYLLIPRHARMLTDARKRINAIKQYSTLGSGFKIAMRDLEIRGAGNMLGPQQSGHITAVGFDLYCQLLKQSVSALKGEKVRPRIETVVNLDFLACHPGASSDGSARNKPSKSRRAKDKAGSAIRRDVASYVVTDGFGETPAEQVVEIEPGHAFLPFDYVTDPQQRISLYRKLAEADAPEEISRLEGELRDRFGPLPKAVERLLQVTGLRILAASRGVTSVGTRGDKLMLTRNQEFVMVGGKFPRLTKRTISGVLKEIQKLLKAI